MARRILLVAGAAFLFSGSGWAEMLKPQAEQERIALAPNNEPATPAAPAKPEAAPKQEAKEAKSDLHPNAKPVYSNGGHFGGAPE